MANPIPPAVLAQLAKAEQDLHEALSICAKGHACGFDMSGAEALASSIRDRIMAVRDNFTPKGGKST